MDVVRDLGGFAPPAGGTAVTIGAYDGVHLGHQALLRQLRSQAESRGLATVVVTFDRHPATVVRPESAPLLLTDLDQKLEVLAGTGCVDATVVITFDIARSQEEPEEFVREVLGQGLAARLVVVGEDFHFGKGRRGNVALLERQGAEMGFEVVGMGLVGPVSSTAVRRLIASGDVAGAGELLGRPYELRGTVVEGSRRGRRLGYPTANIAVPGEMLMPAEGIYAAWYEDPSGTVFPAAVSFGRRATFEDGRSAPVLEAYLLDFEGDLYGQAAKVRFISRLRDDERFDSADELVAQMRRDVDAARLALTP